MSLSRAISLTDSSELRSILCSAIDSRRLRQGLLPKYNRDLRAKMLAVQKSTRRGRRSKADSLAKTIASLTAEEKLALAIELGLA